MRAVEDDPIAPEENEFSRDFLAWVAEREDLPEASRPAGSLSVAEVPGHGFGVFRQGESEPLYICEKESMAFLTAAVLIARSLPEGTVYRLLQEPDASGRYPMVDQDGQVVGSLETLDEEGEKLVKAMTLVDRLRRSSEAMAFLLRAAGSRALERAGADLAWRNEHGDEE
jgi:hypothetical protein